MQNLKHYYAETKHAIESTRKKTEDNVLFHFGSNLIRFYSCFCCCEISTARQKRKRDLEDSKSRRSRKRRARYQIHFDPPQALRITHIDDAFSAGCIVAELFLGTNLLSYYKLIEFLKDGNGTSKQCF